ncbi:MAG: response regulator transcription factor [Clostridiales bacterium]|nr:response regulator transcription factor [Clostridiales bacterium]
MDERKPLVLIVEDDEEMARLNARLLIRQGYDALTALTANVAQAMFSSRRPDLLVLDIELPDGDGRALCRGFRQESDTPVLFLTGKAGIGDRIEGLDAGGDYYLTKPYDKEEFLAVVKSLMRRAELARKKVEEAFVIRRGPLTLMLAERKAYVGGRDAGLTTKEFAVLLLLVQNEDREISCEQIYESVWGIKMNDDPHAVRLHLSRLKKKLGEEGTDGFSILTGYRKGYSFTLQ